MLGVRAYDAKALGVFSGKVWGIEANLLYRLLSTFDGRETMVKELNTYMVERCLGTNNCEQRFSELVQLTGYMPEPQVAQAAFRKADRRMLSKIRGNIKQHVSAKRHYPVEEKMTRCEWSDGQRLPAGWPRSEVAYPATKKVKAAVHTAHTSTQRAAKEETRSTRDYARANALK